MLSVSPQTVAAWRDRYHARGRDALHDPARSWHPARIDGAQRAKITALACSTAPEGRARWTLRLLTDRTVELGYSEAISHNAVKEVLKKTR